MSDNGWPNPDQPGLPVEPERDGWRELREEALEGIADAATKWEAADHAATFVLHTLADALGVKAYTPCDGSETWNGDVAGTVYAILRTAGVLNESDEVACLTPAEVAAAVEAAERRGYELAGCASADAIPSIAKLIEKAQLALSEPPLTMCEALARDVALKPLAMECAAAVEKARAEEREACALIVRSAGNEAMLAGKPVEPSSIHSLAAAIRARGQALPPLRGDGIHDDTEALQARLNLWGAGMSDDAIKAALAEAQEQAELERRREMDADRDPESGVCKGWIGPIEAGRLQDKVRELRARIRELTKEAARDA